MQKAGVLLVNLGTPSAPTALSVATYLNTFLTDGDVIDLPYVWRHLLVKGLIVPFRTRQTLKAYQSIWTTAGSPLRVHMEALQQATQTAFTQHQPSTDHTAPPLVAMGMRYGEPSIASGLAALRKAGCTFFHIIPLYPQYAVATTGSAVSVVLSWLKQQSPMLPFTIYPPFYKAPGFIHAFASRIREHQERVAMPPETFTLFSYHGLPERQVRKMGCTQLRACQQHGACLPQQDIHCARVPADQPNDSHAFNDHTQPCYRAQCFLTSQALIKAAGLNPAQTATAFQSRVGRLPWIQPYTDILLHQLAAKKIKHIMVVCPSFVVDCLETLEEIEIRAAAQWCALGGERLTLVPSLNIHPSWVQAIVDWVYAFASVSLYK